MKGSQSLRDKKPKVRANWYPFSWPCLISLDFLATFAACLKTHSAEEPFYEALTQLHEHLVATGQASLSVLWAAATTIPILAYSSSSPLQQGPSPPFMSPLASCINCWGSEPWEAAANKSLVLFTGGGDEKKNFCFLRQMKESPRKCVFDPPTCFFKLPSALLKGTSKEKLYEYKMKPVPASAPEERKVGLLYTMFPLWLTLIPLPRAAAQLQRSSWPSQGHSTLQAPCASPGDQQRSWKGQVLFSVSSQS